MKLVTEASIKIDNNRTLWVVSTAEGVDVEEVEEVVGSMAGALVEQVTKAYEIVTPSGEKGPRMPPTFQE